MTAGQSGWRFADGITPTPRKPVVVDDDDAALAPAEIEQLLTTEATS